MSLSVIFTLMLLGTLALILLPLLRSQNFLLSRKDYDLTIHRDQLAEIERDVANGLITPEEGDAARNEIYKRALDADISEVTAVDNSQNRFFKSKIAAIILIGALLPACTVMTYMFLGSPELPAKPYAERKNDPEFIMGTEVQHLEAQLDKTPDATEFVRLGDAYSILHQYEKAIESYQKSLQMDSENANVWSDLGEAIGLSQDGLVVPEARAAFGKALHLDPHEQRARFYLGLAEVQNHDPRRAVAIWRDLENDSPPDAPWLSMVKKQIAAVSKKAGFDPETIPPEPPTLSSPDAAEPIMGMAPTDQNEAIRGMVERLAERLKSTPDDLEGWERLAKSYTVLGDTEKAKDAENHVEALKAKEAGQ